MPTPESEENLGFDVPPPPSAEPAASGASVPPVSGASAPPAPGASPSPGAGAASELPTDFAGILKAQQEAQNLPEDTAENAKTKQDLLDRLAKASFELQQGATVSRIEDPAETRKVADAQTEHARMVQLADLARTYPVIQTLIDECEALRKQAAPSPPA